MKKILFMVILSLSLMVCLIPPAWASGLDDAKAGVTALQKGNYDEAIRLLDKAIASGELSQKTLSAVYYHRGFAWGAKGDFDKAIADFTQTIEIDPKHANAYNNRGFAWYAKGDYDKAIADYTKAIEIDPKYADAYTNRGLAWYGKGDYDKAIADYTKAIEIDPKDADAYEARGDAYEARGDAWNLKGDYDKADADYATADALKY